MSRKLSKSTLLWLVLSTLLLFGLVTSRQNCCFNRTLSHSAKRGSNGAPLTENTRRITDTPVILPTVAIVCAFITPLLLAGDRKVVFRSPQEPPRVASQVVYWPPPLLFRPPPAHLVRA